MADLQTELKPGEEIIKEARANLQRGAETVGGRAWLTDQRLIFEPHRFNVQGGRMHIELADVRSTRRAWTKFLGLFPIAYNSFLVTTTDRFEHRIVASGAGTWVSEIDRLRHA